MADYVIFSTGYRFFWANFEMNFFFVEVADPLMLSEGFSDFNICFYLLSLGLTATGGFDDIPSYPLRFLPTTICMVAGDCIFLGFLFISFFAEFGAHEERAGPPTLSIAIYSSSSLNNPERNSLPITLCSSSSSACFLCVFSTLWLTLAPFVPILMLSYFDIKS
jgi:hypothetical protein